MLSYWNETLQNIIQDKRRDKFVFIVNKIRYEVPLSYALGISPYITKQYLNDPTFREIEINDKEKIEDEFSKFISGKEIKKNAFIKFGKLFKNEEMIEKWKLTKKITKETVIESLKDMYEINDKNYEDINEEINFIAEHLEEMKEEIKQLNEEILIYILRNINLSVQSEDTIWEIMKERLKEMKLKIYKGEGKVKEIEKIREKRRILMTTIKVENLSKMNFKEYIEEIEAEDLENNRILVNNEDKSKIILWNQIQKIILNNIIDIKIKKKAKDQCNNLKIEHKEGKDFEGIIKYLEDKHGQNIHQRGIITISASSTYSSSNPEKVIDYHWNNVWYSFYQNPGEWWEINFKKMKVRMNGYSLKTGNDRDYTHLKNWVIEGKNEGEEWKEIDRQINNEDLNGFSYQHYYSIPEMTEPYQYIRIKCIGVAHNCASYYLLLTNLEIFGEIDEEDL